MTTATWGLVLILLGWVFQLFKSMRGSKQINSTFLVLYALGTLMLSVDGIGGGNITISALLNVGALFLALLTWAQIKR